MKTPITQSVPPQRTLRTRHASHAIHASARMNAMNKSASSRQQHQVESQLPVLLLALFANLDCDARALGVTKGRNTESSENGGILT